MNTSVISTSNDPRVRELNRLKLAMATFALQLDTFEVRTYGVLLSIGRPIEDGPGLGRRKEHGRRKEEEIGSQ